MKTSNKQRRARNSDGWRKNTGTTYKEPPTPFERGEGYTPELIRRTHEAADRGEAWALFNLGSSYRDGVNGANGRVLVRKNRRTAVRYLEQAVKLGYIDAMVALGSLLSEDRDERGLARAAPYYRMAYRRGDHTAAFNLACTYRSLGRHREAVLWFRRALAAGDPSASMEIARAELYGVGTRRNVRSAFAKLKAIAKRQSTYWPPNTDRIEAILVMADALMDGWLVRRNFDDGLRWLRRAAELGSEVAKAKLREG